MRFVIIGAGAIGGTVGARLHQSGQDVLLVARGPHHDAIAAHGLTLETPNERTTLDIAVQPSTDAVRWRDGDVVVLATKSQDTGAALAAVRDVAPPDVPIVCLQNGVENERTALRRFAHVYGAVVMAPTAHLEPGIVLAYGTTLTGAIDIGCYPSGIDERCRAMCTALGQATFSSEARPDIMRHKHAKLIANLTNAVQAVCGPDDPAAGALAERLREEGRRVLRAEGTPFEVDEVDDVAGRWARWGVGEIAGRARQAGSSWQSVVRGAASIETDFLNGEIILRGRCTGVPTPANECLQRLAWQTVRNRERPGWISATAILAGLGAR